MKHGPIALIDEAVPVIVCAPDGPLFEKTMGNIQEVTYGAGGQVYLLSDKAGFERLGSLCKGQFDAGPIADFVAPLIYSLPVQMLGLSHRCAEGHGCGSAA